MKSLKFGRMPLGIDPIFANDDCQRIVQEQSLDCCAPDFRQAYDFNTIFAPGKMLLPYLFPWIEKRNTFAGYRIRPIGFCPFVLIAKLTSQTEVFFDVSPAPGFRPYVVNLKSAHHIILMAQTVFATIARSLSNKLAQSFRDHGLCRQRFAQSTLH